MNYCSSNYQTDTTELHTNWVITGNSSSGTLANLRAYGCVDECVHLCICVFDAVKLAVIISRNSKKETFINLTAVSPSLTRNQLKTQVSRRDVMFMTGLGQRMVLLSACKGILRVTDRDRDSGFESLGLYGGWVAASGCCRESIRTVLILFSSCTPHGFDFYMHHWHCQNIFLFLSLILSSVFIVRPEGAEWIRSNKTIKPIVKCKVCWIISCLVQCNSRTIAWHKLNFLQIWRAAHHTAHYDNTIYLWGYLPQPTLCCFAESFNTMRPGWRKTSSSHVKRDH